MSDVMSVISVTDLSDMTTFLVLNMISFAMCDDTLYNKAQFSNRKKRRLQYRKE
jgi:hypothetical protein